MQLISQCAPFANAAYRSSCVASMSFGCDEAVQALAGTARCVNGRNASQSSTSFLSCDERVRAGADRLRSSRICQFAPRHRQAAAWPCCRAPLCFHRSGCAHAALPAHPHLPRCHVRFVAYLQGTPSPFTDLTKPPLPPSPLAYPLYTIG